MDNNAPSAAVRTRQRGRPLVKNSIIQVYRPHLKDI
jgi:hypothetical protein